MHSMFRRSLSLGVWLLVLQVVIVLMTTCAAGLFAAKLQSDRIREAYKDRMLSVALSVARLPTVVQAFDSPDPAATIQPLAELIRHEENGLLAGFYDVEGLADLALRVLRDPQEHRRLGETASVLIEREYSLARTLPRMVDLYRRVCRATS